MQLQAADDDGDAVSSCSVIWLRHKLQLVDLLRAVEEAHVHAEALELPLLVSRHPSRRSVLLRESAKVACTRLQARHLKRSPSLRSLVPESCVQVQPLRYHSLQEFCKTDPLKSGATCESLCCGTHSR